MGHQRRLVFHPKTFDERAGFVATADPAFFVLGFTFLPNL